jgi:XTP/dITP diphosphohydrolase
MSTSPTLLFATRNRHKAEEIRAALGDRYTILTLPEAGIDQEIPEPHDTLEANAREKSMTIHRITGNNCISEDSGLEVEALGGAPGVRSARYAGVGLPASAHIGKLLAALDGQANRKARFRTVISLVIDGQEQQFSGTCEGRIAEHPAGTQGFGYDPIFIPEGQDLTFAQMDMAGKNRYSHRIKAVNALLEFLRDRADLHR